MADERKNKKYKQYEHDSSGHRYYPFIDHSGSGPHLEVAKLKLINVEFP
jgi:hypothetical protein